MLTTGSSSRRSIVSRRWVLQTGGASLALIALAACGASASSSSSQAASGSAPASSSAKPDPNAILHFGQMRGESFDPIRRVAVEDTQLAVIFDTLVAYKSDTGELEPRLATDWKIMADRIRFTLRQGVTFQDGTPLDADAVKYSLDRVQNDQASNIKTTVPMLDHAAVVDKQTVDLLLKQPQPQPLLELLTGRAGMIVSPTAMKAAGSSDAFSKAPVGAGMYKVMGTWHPRESMSVRAWPGYWDKQAQRLAGIDFTELPMAERVNDILAGSTDMDGYDGTDVAALKKEPRLRVFTGFGGGAALVRGLIINTTMDPFTNPKVRQAIAYATDRDAMVKALTARFGKPAYQIFTPDSPAYDPGLEGLYKYDPAKAKQLLSEAGFANGVSFKSIVAASATSYVNFGQLLQAQLKQVGIAMDLQLLQTGGSAAIWTGGPNGHGSAQSSALAGGSSVTGTDLQLRNVYLKDGTQNPGGVETPGIRELADNAAAAPDRPAAAGLYKQANKIITEGLYGMIPMYYLPSVGVMWDYVGGIQHGFTDVPAEPDFFRGVYVTEGKKAA
jgi:ABC-type transport system substrate-binding protein